MVISHDSNQTMGTSEKTKTKKATFLPPMIRDMPVPGPLVGLF